MSSLGEEPHDEEALPGVRALCPRCGAVCEPYQEYCLDCGERLFETKVLAAGAVERVRRAVPFGDRDWLWPVLAALVVAVAAATAAILATNGNATNTLQALVPGVSITAFSGTTTDSQETTTGVATTGETVTLPTTATGTTPTTPVRGPGLIAWPGSAGYTVVIASLPMSAGKAVARNAALRAAGAGLVDVGVLESSDFSSLHPGYYVVFSGVYPSERAALSHLSVVRAAGLTGSYVKRVAS